MVVYLGPVVNSNIGEIVLRVIVVFILSIRYTNNIIHIILGEKNDSI